MVFNQKNGMSKNRPTTTWKGSLIISVIVIQLFGCIPKAELRIVNPKEIDDTLTNPGRGFATTGNLYNEDITTRTHSQSGVIQKRWYWDELEPEEGKINFAMIDNVLEKAHRNGQELNLRVMCQNIEMRLPKWAEDAGIDSPYYDDPIFLQKQENLIKALGARYDGDSRMTFVDIGTIGMWGEWHTGSTGVKMPSDESVRRIVDFYFENFKKTPLVMLIGASKGPGLQYAIEKGAGWRADCWGDMGDNWRHMLEYYPKALESSNAYDAWKQAPIALETCWTIEEWHKQGWDIDYILSKALEWHATEVNNGTEAVPEEWWPKIQEFEKKLGYRFVLSQFEYSSIMKAGDSFNFTSIWENKGVAPIYKQFPVVLQLRSTEKANNTWDIATDVDVTQWIPGSSNVDSNIQVPADIHSGSYEMYIGLVDPINQNPAIKLAIEGRTKDGWYKLGKIDVVN